MKAIGAFCIVSIFVVAGCESEPPPPRMTVPPPHSAAVVDESREDSKDVSALAHDIAIAPDTASEAEGLRRLRRRMVKEGWTYEIAVHDATSGKLLSAGSPYESTVRADITILRGQERVYSFNFVPKDNRNLAILGQ